MLLGGAGRVAEAAARVLAEHAAPTRRPRSTTRPRARRAPPGSTPRCSTRRRRRTSRFKALVFDATGIASSDGARRAAALLLSDGPARAAVRPRDRARRRAARARGLHALARQGDRRAARRSTSCTSRRAPRTRSGRRCASCSRRARRTSPARSCASGQGDGGAARRAARRWSPARSRGIGASIAEVLEREGASVVAAGPQGRRPRARHHRAGRAGRARRALRGRARRPRPQRGRDQGPHAGQDARGPLAEPDGGQPARARADHRGAAAAAERRRADRLRLLDERDRRQRRPDELRDLQGRADRPRHRSLELERGDHDQRGRARVHRDRR